MDKKQLRTHYLQQRKALSAKDYQSMNAELILKLFDFFDFNTVQSVHLFLAIIKFKEVDTWKIIERLQSEYPHLEIIIPKMNGDTLEHYIYSEKDQLKINDWGIAEPQYGKQVTAEYPGCILVPLLVADSSGHRVGYGKGYYDRFLAQASQATKIGLSLFPPIDQPIAVHEHDIPLDYCITPDKVIFFKA